MNWLLRLYGFVAMLLLHPFVNRVFWRRFGVLGLVIAILCWVVSSLPLIAMMEDLGSLRYVAALGLTLLWAPLFAVPLCCACSLLVVFLSPARRAVFDWAVVVLLAISVAATCSAIGGDVRLYGVLLALVLFSWASITAYERQYGPLLPTVHGRPKA